MEIIVDLAPLYCKINKDWRLLQNLITNEGDLIAEIDLASLYFPEKPNDPIFWRNSSIIIFSFSNLSLLT